MESNKLLSATAVGACLMVGSLMASPVFAQRGGDHGGGEHGGGEHRGGEHGNFHGNFHDGVHHEFHREFRHGFHGHRGGGVFFVPEWDCTWGFSRCGHPFPYYPPPVVAVPAQESPIFYAEPDDYANPVASPPYYWYLCDKPSGYYPYIKECPDGWQQVVPQVPPAS